MLFGLPSALTPLDLPKKGYQYQNGVDFKLTFVYQDDLSTTRVSFDHRLKWIRLFCLFEREAFSDEMIFKLKSNYRVIHGVEIK